tara:strand:- start:25 stop:537 length:513 start_codon:yes stop_codon:yes gene_type:complete
MGVSNVFGRGMGERRMQSILSEYPDILVNKTRSKEDILKLVKGIDGFSGKTAGLFVDNMDNFVKFMEELGLENRLAQQADSTIQKKEVDTSHALYNKKIIITGFRNKEIEEFIENVGGKLQGNVSKSTDIVLVKSLEENTGKIEKARELNKDEKVNIRIMTDTEFKQEFI